MPRAPSEPVARLPYGTTSGALLAAMPLPVALGAWAFGSVADLPLWGLIVLVLTGTLLGAAGAVIRHHPRSGRALSTCGMLGLPVLAAPRLPESPALLLLLTATVTIGLATLWKVGGPMFFPSLLRSRTTTGRVRGSAAMALGFWTVVSIQGNTNDPWTQSAVAASMLIALLLGIAWLVRRHRSSSVRSRMMAAGIFVATCFAVLVLDHMWSLVSCGAIYALLTVVFGPRHEFHDPAAGHWWTALHEHPERMLVASFATMAAIGAVVLALPQCSTPGATLRGIDAVFTGVSAVCVTGLIVCDTPEQFSGLGQTVLLVLIQLGGLGIMTFSTAALQLLGGRMTLRQEAAAARIIGTKDRGRLASSAQQVLVFTFTVEAVGALALALLFLLHGDSIGMATWRGVFTAVSAFCNAGFALQTESLVPYANAPVILHVIGLLIVLGGLSPIVVLALVSRRRSGGPMRLQIKLCLVAAVLLLFVGFALFAAIEWNASLDHLSVADKLHNAWFQSVTLRTAGFNSIDMAAVQPASYVMMLLWMFVGASPGGTAGGIKTTTAAVLLLSVADTIRGRSRLTVFGRHIPEGTIQRAAVIVTIALASGTVALMALLLTNPMPLDLAAFEIVSALGTVGLSQGGTDMLDDVGKIIVSLCMFIGRIGGLTIMMFMSQRRPLHGIVLPTEEVDVG